MIRIGLVNIDTSHPLAFARYLHQGERARFVGIYNDGFRGDDEVDAFIRNFGLEKRYTSLDALAEDVDVGVVNDVDWDTHIEHALPFLKKGKPVFIDKPFVGKLSDCLALEKLAAEGAVILGSSSLRYTKEVEAFLAKPEAERGKLLSVYAVGGVDEFNYGIHIAEQVGSILGTGAISTTYLGKAETDGIPAETFFVKYANGTTALYTLCHGPSQPFGLTVVTTKSTYPLFPHLGNLYEPMLDHLCDYLETGAARLASVVALTESVKILLAGRISRERGGEVKLAEIPLDDPGYDGAEFARGYAAASAKIYLK